MSTLNFTKEAFNGYEDIGHVRFEMPPAYLESSSGGTELAAR